MNSAGKSLADAAILDFEFPTGASEHVNFLIREDKSMLNRVRFPKLKVARALIFAVMTFLPSVAAAAPLHDASRKGDAVEVKRLLAAGADANAKDRNTGARPLHEASGEGHAEVVKVLLDARKFLIIKRADVNAKNNNGETPLHWASNRGHAGVAKLLLEAGAGVDARDNDGFTPLHYASAGDYDSADSHAGVVKLLLEAGADVTAKTNIDDSAFGFTPLQLARFAEASGSDRAEVVKLLKAAGGK